MSIDPLAEVKKKYMIDKSKPEWRRKYVTHDGREVEIPESLNGQILLEEHYDERGRLKGWITISPQDLLKILEMRDNPLKRPDVTLTNLLPSLSKLEGKRMRELTRDEFEEFTGHKKYFDRWRREGLTI